MQNISEENWNANQYLKFSKERTEPIIDLIRRINLYNPQKIIDIGCGAGNSTQELYKKWPQAEMSGFDNSQEMLIKAKESNPKIKWFKSSVEAWQPSETYDLIFSNAVLQWVKNHQKVLPRIISYLHHSGILAIQMPAHYNSPIHQQLIAVAQNPRWISFTQTAQQQLSLAEPDFYYNLLAPITSRIEMWETKYYHIMESVQSILEWLRGTALSPYLKALPDNRSKIEFAKELLKEIQQYYPISTDGKVLFPFNRFFLIAQK